ncbi:MAG: FAD-binding oxidoreductase [Planctomycetota bacterium]|jgi:Na+-transporting NADH:ubiquinone oxidoreductase subunit F
MLHVLTAVVVIVGMSAFLAALLIVADALLLDYGECAITINTEERKQVQGGKTLLASLADQEVFIPSACGGRGSCGLCKLKVLEGGGPLLPTETPHLTREEVDGQVRLACQIKVRSDIAVEVPEEILSLREYRTVVEAITELNYDTRMVTLRLLEPVEIAFKPGQYIQLETPPYGKTPEPVYRAYSIASSPSVNESVELIIRLVPNGICTTFVFEVMKEGDEIRINGPYGDFYLREADGEIMFIAGGSGIAPIRSILLQMVETGSKRKATFFYGANELRDLYLVDEMKSFEEQLPNFTYIPALARPGPQDGWQGETGLVTEVIDRHVADASSQGVYLCGGPDMVDAAVELLKTKGLTQDRTFYDKFA